MIRSIRMDLGGSVRAKAMVQVAERRLELREMDVPALSPGEALVRIEATGICGSDKEQFDGMLARAGWSSYPVIPGHEPVGRVVEIDALGRRAWNVEVGDLIAIESVVPCHTCTNCVGGLVKFCSNRFSYGFMPIGPDHGLWGGFAEYMVVRPNSVVHRVPDGVTAEVASLLNPLGAGFDWAVRRAETKPGDAVLVLGAGQRGIACAIAARSAGASRIIITGLSRDRTKLDLARKLGADVAIDIEATPDVVAIVRDVVENGFVDRVIDTTPHATTPVVQAVEAVRPGGTVVLAGLKGTATLAELAVDRVVLKALDVRGVVSVGSWGYQQAMRRLAVGDLAEFHSHSVPLSGIREGIELLAGSEATHVAVVPAMA
jgi:threonine dehydrogenase-like Zn-dependent dehydrogenase